MVEEGDPGLSGEPGRQRVSALSETWESRLASAGTTLLCDRGHIPSPLWPSLTSLLCKEVKLTSLERAVHGDRDWSLSQSVLGPSAWHRAHAQ